MSRHMNRVDALINQLDQLDEKARRSPNRQIPEQDCRKVYDQICELFPNASPDERVDIHVAFESREALVAALLAYETRLTQQASKLADRDKRKEAIQSLELALIADVIIDGRASVEALQEIQNQLLKVAEELHYDVETFLQQMATPAGAYVERAYLFYKQNNRIRAIRCLGRALQLDHTLRYNEKIGDLAKVLTNESPHSAVMLLEDSFLRDSLVQDIERQIKRTQTAEMSKVTTDTSLFKRVFGSKR
jgi:tetratricopeptide (TPR) repeat protein